MVAVAVVAAAVIALPAVASAATFCVHSTAGCAGTLEPSLQAALDGAVNNGAGTRDTIRLPAGTFQDGPAVDAAGNPVSAITVFSSHLITSIPQGGSA